MESRLLFTVDETTTIADAARTMCDRSIGALGVRDSAGELAGLLTERDLTWIAAQGFDLSTTPVSEVLNDFPIVLDGPISPATAASRMRDAHVRHLLLQEGGELRIVSLRDVVDAQPAAPSYAADAMSSPAVACHEDAHLEEVAEVLSERRLSGLPVVDDDGRVTGVISERDLAHAFGGPLIRLVLRRGEREAQTAAVEPQRVRDLMSRPPLTVSADAELDDVASLMADHDVNRIPVLDAGELVGILTRGDVLAAFAGRRRTVSVSPPEVIGRAQVAEVVRRS